MPIYFSRIIVISIVFCCSYWNLQSQQPAYFTLGAEDLKDADVYSIIEDNDNIIYTATNRGLFAYLNGHFVKMGNAKEQIGNSLFSLQKDSKGNIYCCNLKGQIFKLEENRLELFYSIPKKDLGHTTHFEINAKDQLVINSKHVLVLDIYKKQIIFNSFSRDSTLSNFYHLIKIEDDDIMSLNSKGYFRYQSDTIIANYISHNSDIYRYHYYLFGDSNEFEVLIKKSNSHLKILKNGNDISSILNTNIPMSSRWIQFDKNEVFVINRIQGVDVYRLDDKGIQLKESWFQDEFISKIYQTKDGKLLLGTFKEGIHVIPNREIKYKYILKNNLKCRDFCLNNDDIYFVGEDNNIYNYDGNLNLIKKTLGLENIEYIHFIEGLEFYNNISYKNLLFSSEEDFDYRFLLGVKDVFIINENTILFATYNGLYFYNKNDYKTPFNWERYSSLNIPAYFLEDYKGMRIEAVIFNEKDEILYLIKNSEFISINQKNETEYIQFEGEHLTGKALEFYNDTVFIASHNHGVLSFYNGKVQERFNINNGLLSHNIKDIKIDAHRLFIHTDIGFQIINLLNNQWIQLGNSEGIPSKFIKNFRVDDDFLWLNLGSHILSLNINEFKQKEYLIPFSLDSILVNDKKINIDKKIFGYRNKKIQFFTHFKNILLEKECQLVYQLQGADSEWIRTSVNNNMISYKSLSPNKYSFKAYVDWRGQKSEIVEYDFEIRPPFWQTLWFFVALILGLAAIFYLVFRIRLSQIKKINEIELAKQKTEVEKEIIEKEKIESELKALRSQMNPHFIFNSLNSIQDLILQEETDKSYDYIVLFADLVRNTLNYSNTRLIPIQKEIEFLEIYLRLEQLRFKDTFQYNIVYNDSENIEIPSMIVQPFIENSLIHGLLHKQGEKRINITFQLKDKYLECTVVDNGIGRKESEIIRKRQGKKHDSFSLEAIKKRFNILSKQYIIDAKYEIIDLDEGTKVIMNLPYKKIF